jgi:hypothetical protein
MLACDQFLSWTIASILGRENVLQHCHRVFDGPVAE